MAMEFEIEEIGSLNSSSTSQMHCSGTLQERLVLTKIPEELQSQSLGLYCLDLLRKRSFGSLYNGNSDFFIQHGGWDNGKYNLMLVNKFHFVARKPLAFLDNHCWVYTCSCNTKHKELIDALQVVCQQDMKSLISQQCHHVLAVRRILFDIDSHEDIEVEARSLDKREKKLAVSWIVLALQRKEYRMNMGGSDVVNDDQLMIDSCSALLQVLFGEDNWYRWQDVKQRSQLPNLQTFISWMLEIVEQQLVHSEDYLSSSLQQPETVKDTRRCIKVDDHYETDEVIDVTPVIRPDYLLREEGLPSAGGVVEFMHDANKKGFLCQACGISLADIAILQEHINIRHLASSINISCSCCGESFISSKNYIEFHKTRALLQNPSKSQFICDYCAKVFHSRTRLSDHVNTKHTNTGTQHVCTGCGKNFSRRDSMKNHERRCPNLQSNYLASSWQENEPSASQTI